MSGYAPIVEVLLFEQTADETTSRAINCLGYNNITMYVTGNGTTSGGVVTFEDASWDASVFDATEAYTGTWNPISTEDAADVTADKTVATRLTAGAYHWVRARISTAITGGGTLTVILVANSQ
jgi:hypothetical protein